MSTYLQVRMHINTHIRTNAHLHLHGLTRELISTVQVSNVKLSAKPVYDRAYYKENLQLHEH